MAPDWTDCPGVGTFRRLFHSCFFMNEYLAYADQLLSPVFFGNSLRDWLIALLIVLLSTTLARAAYWLLLKLFKRLTARTETHLDDMVIEILEKPLMMSLVICGFWLGLTWLNLPAQADAAISVLLKFAITLMVAWVLVRLVDVLINEYLLPLAEKTDNSLDDQILPILQKGSKIIIWAMALIICFNNAGYDVAALLAGLGIGGIALAMAAKDTIANIFGGITILTDRPFGINDRIKISGYEGTVTDIGVRSTRLRTLEGRTVTIPNMKFAESPVENVSWEPARKVAVELALAHHSSPEQIQQALSLLRQIAQGNPALAPEASVVSFSGIQPASLNVQLVYYIRKECNVVETQSAVNLAILSAFSKAGLTLAYPSTAAK